MPYEKIRLRLRLRFRSRLRIINAEALNYQLGNFLALTLASTLSFHMASTHIDIELRGRFKLAIFLTAITFVAELIGGFIFNSPPALSDSAHVFMVVFFLF